MNRFLFFSCVSFSFSLLFSQMFFASRGLHVLRTIMSENENKSFYSSVVFSFSCFLFMTVLLPLPPPFSYLGFSSNGASSFLLFLSSYSCASRGDNPPPIFTSHAHCAFNAGHSRTNHLPTDNGIMRCLSAVEDLGPYGIEEAPLIRLLLA